MVVTPRVPQEQAVAERPMAAVCGVLVALMGAVVLAGWVLQVGRLQSVAPGLETMKPLTAVSLVLLGAALAGSGDPGRLAQTLVSIAAMGAMLLGVATLGEYAWGRSFGFDAMLFPDQVRAEGSIIPGRMALPTAACVAVAGASILALALGRRRWAHLGGVVAALVAGVAVAGYAYGVSALRQVGPHTSVALHAGVSLVVVGFGLQWATPEQGIVGLARRGPATGLLIRRALPAVIGLPLALGWISLAGERAGWYHPEFAVAIMAIGAAGVGAVVLWRAALAVGQMDAGRSAAIDELARVNEHLEREVASRTASIASQAAVQAASLEALEQGVILSTLDGEVLLINRAGRELLGYEADELTAIYQSGRWVTYREDGSPMPPEERPLRTTMDTGQPTSGRIIVWPNRDGASIVLRVTTQPVLDADGVLTGVVTAVADVTAQRVAERAAAQYVGDLADLNAELSEAVSIKDWFLSTATHDMRNPITSVIGFSDLLLNQRERLSEEQQLRMLDSIHRQGKRLAALVDDLLSIAVIDGGAVHLSPERVELDVMLRQIVSDAAMDDVVAVHCPAGATAGVDPMRLAQMVTNLLQNATRYGRPPITVSVEVDEAWSAIRVADEGDGVDPGFVDRLFDRFATSGASARPSAGDAASTGLGLAIVRGLARAHGGDISYEPIEPSGACFVLRLPREPAI